ncbi:hypothetical protein C0J52_27150, partial [Blattella germanica]
YSDLDLLYYRQDKVDDKITRNHDLKVTLDLIRKSINMIKGVRLLDHCLRQAHYKPQAQKKCLYLVVQKHPRIQNMGFYGPQDCLEERRGRQAENLLGRRTRKIFGSSWAIIAKERRSWNQLLAHD